MSYINFVKYIIILTLILHPLSSAAYELGGWSLRQCLEYALEKNQKIQKEDFYYHIEKREGKKQKAAFLPSVSFSAGSDWSFNDYTTFNNPIGIHMRMPLFKGGELLEQVKRTKLNIHKRSNNIQLTRDNLSIDIVRLFMDVAYYKKTIHLAESKQQESKKVQVKTIREIELGLKSKADLAQVDAIVASDEYNLFIQQNRYDVAIIQLKEKMNYPLHESLFIEEIGFPKQQESIYEHFDPWNIYATAEKCNPKMIEQRLLLSLSEKEIQIAKAKFFPQIDLRWGGTTNYYRRLNSVNNYKPYFHQWGDNLGAYVGISLSITLFNRLEYITSLKRKKSEYQIAQLTASEVGTELFAAIHKTTTELNAYQEEIKQIHKRIDADSLSYEVTKRKYEEGLMSPIDLQTAGNQLLQSQTTLVQKQLMWQIQDLVIHYYQGVPIIDQLRKE